MSARTIVPAAVPSLTKGSFPTWRLPATKTTRSPRARSWRGEEPVVPGATPAATAGPPAGAAGTHLRRPRRRAVAPPELSVAGRPGRMGEEEERAVDVGQVARKGGAPTGIDVRDPPRAGGGAVAPPQLRPAGPVGRHEVGDTP